VLYSTGVYYILQGGSAEIELKKGNQIKLSTDEKYYEIGDDSCIYIDYVNITKVLQVGGLIYLDDGLISLSVAEIGKLKVVDDSKPTNSYLCASHCYQR